MEVPREQYYTTLWSYPDVVMHFDGKEGPLRDVESQELVAFGHQPGVTAYTEDQWHPLMWQNDSVPTTVFEVPAGLPAPDGLRKYVDERV